MISLLALRNFDKTRAMKGQLKVLREFDILARGGIASADRRIPLNEDGNQWQEVSCELLLPTDTKVVFVHFGMMDVKQQKAKESVEFEGSYIDDIQIILEEIPTPML